MNAPYSITTVVVNENMKKVVEPKKRKFKFLSYFGCAAFAGAIASVITIPMDNIKTKLQTQTMSSICEKIDLLSDKKLLLDKNSKLSLNTFSTNDKVDCSGETQIKYKNIFSTVRLVYQEDGFVKGFFKGLTPQLIRNAPSCAISWGTYEIVKHLLISRSQSK
jgi:solute carrier family 25 phosphate transporter 23/24/25/41